MIRNPLKTHVDTVTLGGQKIAIKPMGMQATLEFCQILLPHFATIERYWPEIQESIASQSTSRPILLKSLFMAISEELRDSPGDITRGLALLFGLSERFIAEKVRPVEVLEALPVVDRLNGLQLIYQSAKALRLIEGGP